MLSIQCDSSKSSQQPIMNGQMGTGQSSSLPSWGMRAYVWRRELNDREENRCAEVK